MNLPMLHTLDAEQYMDSPHRCLLGSLARLARAKFQERCVCLAQVKDARQMNKNIYI